MLMLKKIIINLSKCIKTVVVIKISFLLFLLLMAKTVQAETVSIVTYYGKTGGIFGDGKLNVVGSQVNGNSVCPSANDNSNSVPGCDMSSDSGYQSGNSNDPIDDTYTGDLIVRTSDIFELYAGWAINGSSAPVTLSSTLPTGKGLKWEALPSSCKTGSSISADGLSMTCVRSGYDKNGIGSYSEDVPFNIKVLPNTENGVQPGPLNFTITGVTSSNTDTTETNTITITAAPKWNLQKTVSQVVENYNHNGVNGYLIKYLYYLEADEVANEVESSSAVLGNEALGKNFTLEFDDNLTYLPSTTGGANGNNAQLVSCQIAYSTSNDPYPSYNATNPERSVATPLADMVQTCTQTGGAGSTIHIKHTGIDASLEHVPTKSQNGGITPLTRTTVAIGNIEIFIPNTDVTNYGDYVSGNDYGFLDTVNTLGSFDPNSISGQSNFDASSESTNDNVKNQRLYYYGSQYGSGNYYKYFMDNIDNVKPISTSSGWYGADGVLTPNREFAARIHLTNNGNKAFADSILCDVIDTTTYDMVDLVGQAGLQAAKPYRNTTNFNYVIEYASGYIGAWPPPIDDNNSSVVINECSDPSITWHATTAAARATGAITKVRLRLTGGDVLTNTRPSSTTIGMLIKLKTRSTDPNTGQLLPNGTNLVNYTAVHDTVLYASAANNWKGSTKKLHAYPAPAGSGRKADRAVLTRAIARTSKTLDLNVVEPGDVVGVSIDSSYTTDNPDGEDGNVTLVEFLDAGLKYVIGSGNIGDPTFGTCADLEDSSLKTNCTVDDQILIWDLGTRTSNEAIETITFNISVGATAASGTIHTYTAIRSPSDNSELAVRISNKNMTVVVPSALLISKEVNTPFRNPDQSPIEFTTFVRNGASKNLTNLDVIDILPFNGDGTFGFDFTVSSTTLKHQRFQASAFSGTYEFLAAAGGYSCTVNDNWFYSNTDPRQINLAPTANSNKTTGSTTWCAGTTTGPAANCGFSNAEVTAVRLTGPALPCQEMPVAQ